MTNAEPPASSGTPTPAPRTSRSTSFEDVPTYRQYTPLLTIKEIESQMELGNRKTPSLLMHPQLIYGWIQGVLIPCLLNIWGVMLFLRTAWVVAQAGIGLSLVIIAISALVCVITTLSLSAISTNGDVKGGGIYDIISRSLGPELGASISLIVAFSNATAASMNTIGFCNSLNDLLSSHGLKIVDGGPNDVRIVGAIALFLMCIICAIGMDWGSVLQNFLIVIIVGAIINFVVGVLVGPKNNEVISKGFVGLSMATLLKNFKPDFRYSEGLKQNFISVFAIFFPSVTGVQAGINIYGDLKNPGTAIPKGTLLSLLISILSYVGIVVLSGSAALRDASGNVSDLIISDHKVDFSKIAKSCINTTKGCKFGLHNSYSIMQLMSAWGLLTYAGCWAATLSTALTNLLTVPRLIRAVGMDHIYPCLVFFSKPYGRTRVLCRGYVLTFFVSLTFLLIADLNTVAPIISNFYLASYALINFCNFHAALTKPLGWRPSFRFYNVWVSLAGFLGCVVIMVLISWIMSFITIAVFFTLYLVVVYRQPVIWRELTHGHIYKTALCSADRLNQTVERGKNYWPQLLVLTGKPYTRPALVDLGNLITKNKSLMVVGNVCQIKLAHAECIMRSKAIKEWLRRRKVRAFYSTVSGFNFETGARALLQASGVGKLAPDILLIGYKTDWITAAPQDLMAYFNVLHATFEGMQALTILRVPGGLDYGSVVPNPSPPSRKNSCPLEGFPNLMYADSDLDIQPTSTSKLSRRELKRMSVTISENFDSEQKVNSGVHRLSKDEILQKMNVFQRTYKAGTLDVWWLYDDGGLTILLPYIISQRSEWEKCQLRIFVLANKRRNLTLKEKEECLSIADLLAKYGIDYSSLTEIQDITEPPQKETITFFEEITKKFNQESSTNVSETHISETELLTLGNKTLRQLRLRELLLAYSCDANLVVMSLPKPRKGSVSAALYMSWLEVLSCGLPPVLFVRGNHTAVLTC